MAVRLLLIPHNSHTLVTARQEFIDAAMIEVIPSNFAVTVWACTHAKPDNSYSVCTQNSYRGVCTKPGTFSNHLAHTTNYLAISLLLYTEAEL